METFPTWIRLHPSSEDETLAISVQARIHDPLWLLGRQWQFGELRHDGGATPIDVRVEGTTAPLSRMRGGGADVTTGRSAAIKPSGTPLEALVEREAVRETGVEQLRLRSEAGLHLLRMLRAAGLPNTRVAFWIAEGAFVLPPTAVLDDEGREWWGMVEGRHSRRWTPPGGDPCAPGRAGATPPIDPPEATVLRAWLTWAGNRFELPSSGPSTWSPEHMEYAFSVAGAWLFGRGAADGAGVHRGPARVVPLRTVTGERDVGRDRAADGTPCLPRAGTARLRRDAEPALLDLRGSVRAVRSDRRALQPGRGAVAGDDDGPRFRVELQRRLVPIADRARCVVAVRRDDGGRNGRVRRRNGRPASGRPLEPVSIGLERNTVHTLEPVRGRRPCGGHRRSAARGGAPPRRRSGQRGVGRGAAGLACHRTCGQRPGPPPPQPAATPTGLVWTLAPPSPPGNWFPLLPTTIGRLALGALWSARTQRPAGQVLAELRASRQPLHQSEVPPEGAQVSRRWQSARAIDGTLHFWIGRSKTPRLTDTAPAVRFDVVEYR